MSLRGNFRYFRKRANNRQTTPSVEPFSAEDLRTHLRLPEQDMDRYLTDLIKEAREFFEDKTGIALISQTWKLTLDSWAEVDEPWWDGVREGATTELFSGQTHLVEIPVHPLISVDSIKTYDTASTSTTVTVADVFHVDLERRPGRLVLKSGSVWPTAMRNMNAVEINYTAGFGTAASDIPATLKRAVKQMAAHMYQHRGDGCTPKDAFVASGAESLAGSYVAARL